MREQNRWVWLALIPVAVGLAWLNVGLDLGFFGWLCLVPAGIGFIGTGFAAFGISGDGRITAYMSVSCLLGALSILPTLFMSWYAWLLLLTIPVVFLVAGLIGLRQLPPVAGVPEPRIDLKLALKSAVDDIIVGIFNIVVPTQKTAVAARLQRETDEAIAQGEKEGWLEDPASFHAAPPAELLNMKLEPKTVRDRAVEHLTFDSIYEPRDGLPGRERWLGQVKNSRASALILRADDDNAPWVIGIHGYQMGKAYVDFLLYNPEFYTKKLGVNLILPVLPLHGPRSEGRLSGDGFITGDFIDTLNATAQGITDIRQILQWLKAEQGATKVGVIGFSLGGYMASILASVESDLEFALPAIAAADIPDLVWHYGAPLLMRTFEERGLTREKANYLGRVITPTAMQPLVPEDARYICGGVIDRVTPPHLQRDLAKHWGVEPVWYQGGHMTSAEEPEVRDLIQTVVKKHLFS